MHWMKQWIFPESFLSTWEDGESEILNILASLATVSKPIIMNNHIWYQTSALGTSPAFSGNI